MVTTGFKTKQVNTLTLSERLKEARVAAGFSMEKLSEMTKIPVKYIRHLEEENYERLPAEIYVKGFLRQYSSRLKIDPQPLIDSYVKELNIRNNIKKSLFGFTNNKRGRLRIKGRSGKKNNLMDNFSRPRFVITPKFILAIITIIVLLSVGFYFWYQIRTFFKGPALEIFEPVTNAVIRDAKITLRGKTDCQAVVKINGTVISLSSDGIFSQTLNLNEGSNIIKIVSINRQGKSSEAVRSIIVDRH